MQDHKIEVLLYIFCVPNGCYSLLESVFCHCQLACSIQCTDCVNVFQNTSMRSAVFWDFTLWKIQK